MQAHLVVRDAVNIGKLLERAFESLCEFLELLLGVFVVGVSLQFFLRSDNSSQEMIQFVGGLGVFLILFLLARRIHQSLQSRKIAPEATRQILQVIFELGGKLNTTSHKERG